MEEQFETVDHTYRGNIWCTPQERRDWRLYITELGDDPKSHIEGLDMIRTAEEEDVVEILITSPGGYCNIADMYLAAIADSKAKIITRAIGECCSAATTIFLAGHERVCDDGCYFMFHNVQFGGMGGDSANVFSRTKFYERLFKEKSYAMMSEVLNEEELAELFDRAGEVYLTAEEMRERLAAAGAEHRRPTDWNGETKITMDFGNMRALRESEDPRGGLSPKEWWDLVIKNQKGGDGQVVSMPFPPTPVAFAGDFPQGDEFDITLDEGYKKTFRLSTLGKKDFDEYNTEELQEIGFAFGIGLSGMTRDQMLESLIDEIQNGGGEQ